MRSCAAITKMGREIGAHATRLSSRDQAPMPHRADGSSRALWLISLTDPDKTPAQEAGWEHTAKMQSPSGPFGPDADIWTIRPRAPVFQRLHRRLSKRSQRLIVFPCD